MVSRTSARLLASQARIGSYASKIGFQMGSFSRRRSLANPIVGVCDVAIAPMILAMIAFLMSVRLLGGGSHHPHASPWRAQRGVSRRVHARHHRSAIVQLNRLCSGSR